MLLPNVLRKLQKTKFLASDHRKWQYAPVSNDDIIYLVRKKQDHKGRIEQPNNACYVAIGILLIKN